MVKWILLLLMIFQTNSWSGINWELRLAQVKADKKGQAPKVPDEIVIPKQIRDVAAQIDRLIQDDLAQKNIRPGKKISDERFLRRIYLDLIGRIPKLKEYEVFMESSTSYKRSELIDQLLESPGYVSHSHNYWMDALRVKSFNFKSYGEPYIKWLRDAIQSNMPYDKFVHALISSEGLFNKPDNGATGYYMRDAKMINENVSNTMQLFLGTNLVCAQCHNHPYEDWTQMDFYKLAAFVNGTIVNPTWKLKEYYSAQEKTKEDIGYVYRNLSQGVYKGGAGQIALPDDYSYKDGKPGQVVSAGTPFGPSASISFKKGFKNKVYDIGNIDKEPSKDYGSRKVFADWITSSKNSMFSKTIVNRLWKRAFGMPLLKGTLLSIDQKDMGINPSLTAYLQAIIKKVNYDQKIFLKILFHTQFYQSESFDVNKSEEYAFQGPIVERLTAEQIWDSLLALRSSKPENQILSGKYVLGNLLYNEMIDKSIKERFEYATNRKAVLKTEENATKKNQLIPEIRLSASDVRASLMRSPSRTDSFLGTYGQSEREIIDGAIKEATIPQALRLMNNDLFMRVDSKSKLYQVLRINSKSYNKDAVELIYKAVLSRKPSKSEQTFVKQYFDHSDQASMKDLHWALINSTEFKLKI